MVKARGGLCQGSGTDGAAETLVTGAQVTKTGRLRCGSGGAATAGTLGTAAATAELGNSGHEGGGSRSFRARWEGENMKCLFG